MVASGTAESGYGSDDTGLVWGYLFTPDHAPTPIDCAHALQRLSDSMSPESDASPGFVWLHFSLSNAASPRWLREHLELPDSFYDSLHERVGSTRLEIENGAVVAVVHDVVFNTTFDAESISTLTLYMEPRVIVSARLRPLRSLDRLRAAVRLGLNLRSTAELLAHLLRDQASVLVDIVRQSTSRIDATEDKLLSDRITISRGELSALRRALVRLQRLLAPEPTALSRLLSQPPTWLSPEDLEGLRSAAEEFSIAVADSAALAERLKLLQEELAAKVSEHINRSLFILTLVTVLALPINLTAGLLGMNVGGIPFAQHSEGFLLIVSGLTLVTGLLAYFFLLRRRD